MGYEEQKISVKIEDIPVEPSYNGPKLESIEDITPEWIQTVMDWQRDSKKLHRKYALMIIVKATEVLESEKVLQHITLDDLEEITVCGDTHG
jgi:serine/threonine-protein phosphatase 5